MRRQWTVWYGDERVCGGLPDEEWGMSGDNFYCVTNGTAAADPVTSGAAVDGPDKRSKRLPALSLVSGAHYRV